MFELVWTHATILDLLPTWNQNRLMLSLQEEAQSDRWQRTQILMKKGKIGGFFSLLVFKSFNWLNKVKPFWFKNQHFKYVCLFNVRFWRHRLILSKFRIPTKENQQTIWNVCAVYVVQLPSKGKWHHGTM